MISTFFYLTLQEFPKQGRATDDKFRCPIEDLSPSFLSLWSCIPGVRALSLGCHCHKMASATPGVTSSPDSIQPKTRALSLFSRGPRQMSLVPHWPVLRHLLPPKLALVRAMGLSKPTGSNQNLTPEWGWGCHP